MKQISSTTRDLIQEINQLWETVYPYLASHIQDVYGRNDGVILEIGPFCGVIFSLMAQGVGSNFMVGAFPPSMAPIFNDKIRKKGFADNISVIETDESLIDIKEKSVDLVIFRGALFFPSLFRVDYQAISMAIKAGGVAIIGGGFGKFTPPDVIQPIAGRSKDLNLKIGKIEVTAEQVKEDIEASGAQVQYQIVHEGGLWVILNKG